MIKKDQNIGLYIKQYYEKSKKAKQTKKQKKNPQSYQIKNTDRKYFQKL